MSCVIGLVHKKRVYLASDGVASTEDGDTRPIDAIKLFRKGNYLFGFAGSIRTGQIIQHGDFDIPKSIWGWPDAIREQITEKGAIITGECQGELQSSNFLIGFKQGLLYEMLADFQMNQVNETGYTAIGAGSTVALGSLYTTADLDWSPEDRLYKALNAATQFVRSCGPPFKIEVI